MRKAKKNNVCVNSDPLKITDQLKQWGTTNPVFNLSTSDLDYTLEDDRWKDSFDKLMDQPDYVPVSKIKNYDQHIDNKKNNQEKARISAQKKKRGERKRRNILKFQSTPIAKFNKNPLYSEVSPINSSTTRNVLTINNSSELYPVGCLSFPEIFPKKANDSSRLIKALQISTSPNSNKASIEKQDKLQAINVLDSLSAEDIEKSIVLEISDSEDEVVNVSASRIDSKYENEPNSILESYISDKLQSIDENSSICENISVIVPKRRTRNSNDQYIRFNESNTNTTRSKLSFMNSKENISLDDEHYTKQNVTNGILQESPAHRIDQGKETTSRWTRNRSSYSNENAVQLRTSNEYVTQRKSKEKLNSEEFAYHPVIEESAEIRVSDEFVTQRRFKEKSPVEKSQQELFTSLVSTKLSVADLNSTPDSAPENSLLSHTEDILVKSSFTAGISFEAPTRRTRSKSLFIEKSTTPNIDNSSFNDNISQSVIESSIIDEPISRRQLALNRYYNRIGPTNFIVKMEPSDTYSKEFTINNTTIQSEDEIIASFNNDNSPKKLLTRSQLRSSVNLPLAVTEVEITNTSLCDNSTNAIDRDVQTDNNVVQLRTTRSRSKSTYVQTDSNVAQVRITRSRSKSTIENTEPSEPSAKRRSSRNQNTIVNKNTPPHAEPKSTQRNSRKRSQSLVNTDVIVVHDSTLENSSDNARTAQNYSTRRSSRRKISQENHTSIPNERLRRSQRSNTVDLKIPDVPKKSSVIDIIAKRLSLLPRSSLTQCRVANDNNVEHLQHHKSLGANISLNTSENLKVIPAGNWRRTLSAWKSNRKTTLACGTNIANYSQSLVNGDSAINSFLLEPTDDELYNLSTLSIRDTDKSGNPCEAFGVPPTAAYNQKQQIINDHQSLQQQQQQQLQLQKQLYKRRRTSVLDKSNDYFSEIVPSYHPIVTSVVSSTTTSSLSLTTKDVVLRRCGQSEPLQFSEVYSSQTLRNSRKIGEGVYGEVFMNKTSTGQVVVLKIIPIEGPTEINGEPQKKYDEILSEIVIAMELSNLRKGDEYMTNGFVEVLNVRCVQGRYPDYLVELWELYKDNNGTDNDHPEIFNDEQLFIVLELGNGGQDLEAFTFENALQSHSAFLQTAVTLAVAEKKFKFEHRDLHWGNILLLPTNDKEITYKLDNKIYTIPTHGVRVTIIDFTLSRMTYDNCCLYNDLANDEELFTADGDYQFAIYRLMKDCINNRWELYNPYTNILWLHYIIDKMISGARYRLTKNKKHRSAIHEMMILRDYLLDYKSAYDYIQNID